MASNFTRTRTATRTFARLELLLLQVDLTLTRMGVSGASKILLGIREGLIADVSLYGMDGDGMCRAELFMHVDWERHELHLAAGRDKVTIDSRWGEDSVAVETEKTRELFERYCTEHGLYTTWHIRYRPGVDYQRANQMLGFSSAQPVQWQGGHVGTKMSIPELDEFTIGVELVDGV